MDNISVKNCAIFFIFGVFFVIMFSVTCTLVQYYVYFRHSNWTVSDPLLCQSDDSTASVCPSLTLDELKCLLPPCDDPAGEDQLDFEGKMSK